MAGVRRSLLFLKVMAGLHAVLALAQPIIAGTYLDGSSTAIRVHESAGSTLPLLALAALVAAFLDRRRGGPVWPAIAAGSLMIAETAQIMIGYSRSLAIHIPLGVAIVVTSILFAHGAGRLR
jgi:hypothetical protein